MCHSTAAKHRKTQDENNDLCSAIQSSRDEVVVLHEERGPIPAKVKLREEADGEVGQDRGVDADEEPAYLRQ